MEYIKLFEEFIKALEEYNTTATSHGGGNPPIGGLDDDGDDDGGDDDIDKEFDPEPSTIHKINALNWYIGDEHDMAEFSSQVQNNSKGFVIVSDPMKYTIEPPDDDYEDEDEDEEGDGMGTPASGDFEDVWKIQCFNHNGRWVIELIFPEEPYVFGRKIAPSPESIIKIAEKWSGVQGIRIIDFGKTTARTPWASAIDKQALAKMGQNVKSGGARGMSQDARDAANLAHNVAKWKINDN